MAALAAHPQESSLEPAALQVRLELLFHVAWQRPVLRDPPVPKLPVVLCHDPVEQRRLGLVAVVSGRRDEAAGLGEIVRDRHGLLPCKLSMSRA